MYFGLVLREARKEARSRITGFFRDGGHFGFDASDLAQAELVDFVGSHVRGGAAVDIVFVALLAVREGRDGEGSAAVRRILGGDERGETFCKRERLPC